MRAALRNSLVFFGLAIAVSSTALSTGPRAQASPEVMAEALFEEGRNLVASGRIEEGCSALERSQELDPGAGTLLNLALCHEAEGKTDLARRELEESLATAERDGREDRAAIAREHLAMLPRTHEAGRPKPPRHVLMGIELAVTAAVFFAAGTRRRPSPA